MIRDALYIAARAPQPGFTKSRLGRAIGDEQAASLYAAFLRDLADRFAAASVPVGWYVTPEDAWPEIAPLVAPAGPTGAVIAQGSGDWTERQRALFVGATSRGEARTVLTASDSPHIEARVIAEAFVRLEQCDLVLGPTEDGGYYAIGMRSDGGSPWNVLSGLRMSTGTVLDELLARADRLGLLVGLLPTTFDVDEAADLERLIPLALQRNDLLATRAELGQLGLLAGAPATIPTRDSSLASIGGR